MHLCELPYFIIGWLVKACPLILCMWGQHTTYTVIHLIMQYTVIHYRDASMVLTGQLHFTVIYNLAIFILLHFGRKLGAIAKNFCQNCFLFDRHWMDGCPTREDRIVEFPALKFCFSEKATKICTICLMVLTFT